jgi:primosomal protein N' (replication factor Y)
MKGTEALEREVAELLPGARVARLDSDSTKTQPELETQLAAFSSGELDAVVATQMVVGRATSRKVAVLVVVSLDALYEAPAYDAAEASFCTVARLACDLPGLAKFIVQTHEPDHYMARALASGDPNLFYGPESETRAELGYPPFGRLAVFDTTSGKDVGQGIAEAIAGSPAARAGTVDIAGPESFVSAPGARRVWRVLAKLKEGVSPGELVGAATAGLTAEAKRRLMIRFIP